jgi:hypothetical protein
MGPFFAAVTELFPTSQRYTGLSVGYNIGAALFGGTAPLFATFLIEWSGNVLAHAFYLSFCATVSLAITFPLRNRAPAQAASAEAAKQEALISLDPWAIKRCRRREGLRYNHSGHANTSDSKLDSPPSPTAVGDICLARLAKPHASGRLRQRGHRRDRTAPSRRHQSVERSSGDSP